MRRSRARAPLYALSLLSLAAACSPGGRPADSPGIAPETLAAPGPAPADTAADEAARGATATTALGDATGRDPILDLGLETYRHQYCGICHRLDAADTGGVFGPTHNAMGRTAAGRIQDPNYGGTATTAEAYIRESIVDPDAYIVPGFEFTRHRMPAYTALGDVELDALVQLLLEQE